MSAMAVAMRWRCRWNASADAGVGVSTDPYGRASLADLLGQRGDQAPQPGPVEYVNVAPATEIIPVKGAEVLGTFPAEIQDYVVLIGGVGNSARNRAPAKELLTYVTAPAADAVVRQTGMERN